MRDKKLIISSMVFCGALGNTGGAWSQSGMSTMSEAQAESIPIQHLSQGDVRLLQEVLRDKGHDPGPLDGVLGPRTQQALRSFQQLHNVPATGQLDGDTKRALGIPLIPSSKNPSSVDKRNSTAGTDEK